MTTASPKTPRRREPESDFMTHRALIGILAGALAAIAVAVSLNWSNIRDRQKPMGGPAVAGADMGETAPLAAPASASPFRVPKPGDPEYADYQEMLKYPKFRSSVENSPGFEIPYDPEWRTMITGRRRAAPVSMEFTEGTGSIEDLGIQLTSAVRNIDDALLGELRVSHEEYCKILWPEFPQSRPYLKIPPDEAWIFEFTNLHDQMSRIINRVGGHALTYRGFTPGDVQEFTNFTMYQNVNFLAVDDKTGDQVTVAKGAHIVERHGRYKFLTFGDGK